MATANNYQTTTIEALEAMTGVQYHAVAFNDGKLANNGEEASGILLNKPAANEFAVLAVRGECKFKAGAAITKGAKLTVATSGWFTTADSSDAIVGEAKYTTTSGSMGTGLFSCAGAAYPSRACFYTVTPAVNIVAGNAYALDDNKQAYNGEECDGCAPSAISSGIAGEIVVAGVTQGIIGGAAVSAGGVLTVAGSGYFTAGDSGDYIVAKALTAITSGSTGDIAIQPVGYYLSV